MRGNILAGGQGSRLYPLTLGISKHLLPVYDKPMIYYPLTMLMFAGIREILIICNEKDMPAFLRLLGDGSKWGLKIVYEKQNEPRGLPDAFILGEDFIGDESVCLILGDNIFFGNNIPKILRAAVKQVKGATIFAYPVKNPTQYGVVEIDDQGRAISLEEKPKEPKSNLSIPGLYFYDNRVSAFSKTLKSSSRGEMEITELNRIYLELGQLKVKQLGRGIAWFDTGKPDSLLQASNFVQSIEERQGVMISSPEEIAYRMEFITIEELSILQSSFDNNYCDYLSKFIKSETQKQNSNKE